MQIRVWAMDDADAIDALLDPEPDPLWAGQGHRLHGEPREGERWRRTWLAVRDGDVLGAVTLGRNWVHPARYSCAVEVAPGARRRGVGRRLVEHALAVRPEPLPLNGKVRERDPAGRGLSDTLGATSYQRSPCPRLNPPAPDVRAWCETAWCETYDADVASFEAMDSTQIASAFAELYRWIHEGWAPVGPEHALAAMCEQLAAETDRALSRGLWRDGRLVAAAFMFRAEAGRAECVVETLRRDEPEGTAAVAAVVAGVLGAAREAGRREVEFDGHDTDPHLAPVVAGLPPHDDDPLLVVELVDLVGTRPG